MTKLTHVQRSEVEAGIAGWEKLVAADREAEREGVEYTERIEAEVARRDREHAAREDGSDSTREEG